MSAWHDDLSDTELADRLAQRGMPDAEVRYLVRNRDTDEHVRAELDERLR